MPDLVRQVQLLDGVVEVKLALIVEFPHLLMLYQQGTVLEVDLVVLGFDLFEFSLELLDAFLALLLDLAEPDDLALALLRLQLDLVHLGDQGAALLLVDLLQVLRLLKLQLQVLLLVLQPSNLRLKHIDLQLVLCQVFHEFLELVLSHVQFVLRPGKLAFEVLHLSDLDVDLPL